MIQMDKKALCILSRYREQIESNLFDEMDLLGFLIFVRSYIEKSRFPGIYEFCNLIAHRNRDQGTVMECIEHAIENNYEALPNSKEIKGYQGITKEQWDKEWTDLGSVFSIHLTSQTLSEIMLCLFSLTQYTEYKSSKGSGTIVVFQGLGGKLALMTTEGQGDSKLVCFSTYEPYVFQYDYLVGWITDVIETRRVGTELHLYAGEKRII